MKYLRFLIASLFLFFGVNTALSVEIPLDEFVADWYYRESIVFTLNADGSAIIYKDNDISDGSWDAERIFDRVIIVLWIDKSMSYLVAEAAVSEKTLHLKPITELTVEDGKPVIDFSDGMDLILTCP